MNKKLERLGDELEEIRVDASVCIGPWAIGEMRRLLKDLPPETTAQEIVDALEDYA
jgi:hypothetical protein